jgi:hypothetical protein
MTAIRGAADLSLAGPSRCFWTRPGMLSRVNTQYRKTADNGKVRVQAFVLTAGLRSMQVREL